MATGNQSSPDLDDALNLFVGDISAKADLMPSVAAERQTTRQSKATAPAGTKSDAKLKRPAELPTADRNPVPQKIPSEAEEGSAAAERPKTRIGRPLGVKSGAGRLKDKTSLSLDLELMDRYREQCWDEHCQLGELVERALRDYAVRMWEWKLHGSADRAKR